MSWYDTYRTTKVNYFLINLSLATGPLIYLYVKSITQGLSVLKRKDFLHFVPVAIFVIFKIGVLLYDAMQPGFSETQNGVLMSGLIFDYVNPLLMVVVFMQKVLYLAFSLQLYFNYKEKIQQFFSNTFQLELNWLRNFLFLYTFLFVYHLFQSVIDLAITNLSYIQEWWYYLFSAVVILYVGIKGYFTNIDTLRDVQFNTASTPPISELPPKADTINQSTIAKQEILSEEILQQRKLLAAFMEEEKPYLNPELNLIQLAKELRMTRAQLSEIINIGYQKNFNDYINQFRVEAVKQSLREGNQERLSLLGIALECGFNSKATFNRVFKKFTGLSPTGYLRELN
ncbi:MAG: helix-turn-helix domain-containing protein [Saprospiraceae bacterium]